MANPDTMLCRLMLKRTHADVLAAFPEIRNVREAADVVRTSRQGQWSVHIAVSPSLQLQWDGNAYNATDARLKAWGEFMRRFAPEAA